MIVTQRKNRYRKRSCGQALIQGIFLVQLLAVIVVLGIVFLTWLGSMSILNAKLQRIADAAAQYGVDCNYFLGAKRPGATNSATDSAVRKIVNELLQSSGFDATRFAIDVDLSRQYGCSVTLRGGITPIFGSNSPLAISVQGFKGWLYASPFGVAQVDYPGNGRTMTFPAYGAGAYTPGPTAGPIAFAHDPYWENGGITGMPKQWYGPYQNKWGGGWFQGWVSK